MKRSIYNWSVKQILTSIQKETITFNNPIQRPSGQWDMQKKSLLIHSVLQMFVPDVYVIKNKKIIKNKKNEDYEINTYDVIDGKQRLSTIQSFVNNEFVLENVEPVTLELETADNETYEIEGKYFQQLEPEVQEAILSYSINVRTIELSENEDEELIIEDIFYRLNNGTAVSKEHLTFIRTSKEIQEFVRDVVTRHPLFNEISAFSKSQNLHSVKELTVLNTIMLISGESYKSFAAKDVNQFFKDHKIDNICLNSVREAFDTIAECFETKNRYLQKTHIPIFATLTNEDKFKEFITDFVKTSTKNDSYRRYCGAGSIKKENVFGRIKGLSALYKEFVK